MNRVLILLCASLLFTGCAGVQVYERRMHELAASSQTSSFVPEGQASWYGGKFHGRTTASGEKFDKNAMTAAHVSLPFGTRLQVTNQETGKSIIVRINDRMPKSSADKGRVVDLSEGAFSKLAPTERGLIPVRIAVVN